MLNSMIRSRLETIISLFVSVHPHEISTLLHSFACFFFILSAYFLVLPLRDEGAISLGLSNLPGLFVGSLGLTLIAAPVSTLVFSLPNLSKGQALFFIHRFFSVSLLLFFILWSSSSAGYSASKFMVSGALSSTQELDPKLDDKVSSAYPLGSGHKFYVSVRIVFFLWVALLNLITISSTWARIIDAMDGESGSRLFGFIGAGATLGQLFGSLLASLMAWLGSFLLLFSAVLMEFAAQSSKGIKQDDTHPQLESSPIREPESDKETRSNSRNEHPVQSFPNSITSVVKLQFWTLFDGFLLILSSSYLLYVCLFIWMSAIISSFFYFQKVAVIAETVSTSIGRRTLFAQINSFIAIFILVGQLTLTGRILTIAGVTAAICSAPFVGFLNLAAVAVWPTWVVIAITETLRKVVTYVVTRPGRELLFTVVSRDEKYKAKVCIDVFVQRLGDATAAGLYKLLFSSLNGRTSDISLYVLPVCLVWIVTAFHVGGRREQLENLETISSS